MRVVIVFLWGIHLANALENLALRKRAYQSSTSRSANRAVDGNVNTNLLKGHSCSQTGYAATSWWEVDLGDVYYIDSVKVFNRMECCSYRLSNVQLYIGYSRWMSNYVLRGYHPGAIGRTYIFKINPGVYGRWVRITRDGNFGQLALCEVQVFGEKGQRKMLFQLASNQTETDIAYDSNTASSAVHCSTMCLVRPDCVAVNYHNASDTCDFLQSTTQVTEENYNTRYIRYP